MNREEIIKLAREAGLGVEQNPFGFVMFTTSGEKELQRFAALVAAAEREECAKVVESAIPFGKILDTAAAIRARGTEK